MPVYRYRWSILNAAKLAKVVPGALTLGDDAPSVYKDITAPSGSLADLTDYMTSLGWVFDSTDPVTTPAQQSALNTLARISGYDEGSLLAKRAGLNFVGDGVTAADDQANDRIIVTIPGGGGSFDARDVILMEHFFTGNTSTNTTGRENWRVSITGTGPSVDCAFEAGHPGIIRISAGTSAAARATVFIGETSQGARFKLGAGGNGEGVLTVEWLCKYVGATSLQAANLERTQFGFGLDWTSDTEMADGAYVRFTPGVDAYFSLVTSVGGVKTVQAGNVVPAANTWYRMKLVWTPGAGIQFFINDVSQGAPVTTNIPTGGLGVGWKIQQATVGGISPLVDIDYCIATQVTKKEGA
jgi:hypothetical protein